MIDIYNNLIAIMENKYPFAGRGVFCILLGLIVFPLVYFIEQQNIIETIICWIGYVFSVASFVVGIYFLLLIGKKRISMIIEAEQKVEASRESKKRLYASFIRIQLLTLLVVVGICIFNETANIPFIISGWICLFAIELIYIYVKKRLTKNKKP